MEELKLLAQEAIDLALAGEWSKAVEVNLKISKKEPKNIEALNRLARAYIELGKKKEGRSTIQKVLSLDEFNPIALRNFKRINNASFRKTSKTFPTLELFIEEPGKTKTVQLVNLADKSVINKLGIGEELNLVPRERRISLMTQSGIYLGKLPDDISLRLKSLIKGGNQYQVFVRSLSDGIKVFIREVLRAKKFANLPSFVSHEETDYQSFTPPDLIHEEPPQVFDEEGEEETIEP